MTFTGDERAQSVQVGAVLLFGVLIIAFSSYQAFAVPDQNREVEFNHNQEVQRDMIDVRNTLLETYTGGNDGYAEVALGTNFPARVAAINPPRPSGSLYTTSAEPITIEEGGTDKTDEVCPGSPVQTRFLEYSPDYSVYDGAGTIRYESSFLLHDFGDRSVPLTDQTLVRGDEIQIVPLTNDFNTGGSQTVAVEPRAGRLDTTELNDPVVTLPTRAREETWKQLLEDEDGVVDITVIDDEVTIEFSGTYTIECGPVGVGETPSGQARGSGSDGSAEPNPASPGDITLVDESYSNGDKTVTLEFSNTGNTNNFTEARINFYNSGTGGKAPTEGYIRESGAAQTTLEIGDPLKPLNAKIELTGNDTPTPVEIEFNNSPQGKDWFILTLELETGETALYFVSLQK